MSNVVIERRVAYSAVFTRNMTWNVVIAEYGEPGYVIDPAEGPFSNYLDADRRAIEKNRALGINAQQAWDIVSSAMAASRALGKHWEPR